MNFVKAILSVIIIAFAGISYAGTVDGLESWEQWENIFGKTDKQWKLMKEKNGALIYSRHVDISTVNAFKGIVELETDLNSLTALLLDCEYYPEWMRLTHVSEIVKKVSETEYYRYTINRLKWPLKSRDCSIYNKGFYNPDTGAVMLRFEHKPDYVPREKKYIRIPIIIGYYMITPLPNGNVKLTFEAVVDMGGWLPSWIVNFYLADVPYGTFESIQNIMPLDRYKGVSYNYTKDFSVQQWGDL